MCSTNTTHWTLIDRWYHIAAGLLDCHCRSADGPTWCLFACWTNLHSSTVVAGSLEILISQWKRLLQRGGGGERWGGRREGCIKCSTPVLLCCCGWWTAEERREESLSEVTHGGRFIFRAANYLTAVPNVCVHAWACTSVCHYLSESQGDVARCPLHTTEFTKRAVCTERDQSWKDWEQLSRLERKRKRNGRKNTTRQDLI